ncbi:hypothetical protein SODALDRAFT_355784 [Sodiomyces alkalinus F11]|uniref:EF-hand domain-containing protein n=1 Tax=Sodiomyces alkalinus (strain CBS 110278 / VKM F-3762 / F11) TaxID=1314773 RepID=A0A3N2QA02_SODAK|nr:hypothetical protein SODALDRAFT_355784 [Sodiomyces alkalinus F11]ROT43566.1 hypothetical protein SODALDRAFT_355784 [Sodiomyces alkalinus F11]
MKRSGKSNGRHSANHFCEIETLDPPMYSYATPLQVPSSPPVHVTTKIATHPTSQPRSYLQLYFPTHFVPFSFFILSIFLHRFVYDRLRPRFRNWLVRYNSTEDEVNHHYIHSLTLDLNSSSSPSQHERLDFAAVSLRHPQPGIWAALMPLSSRNSGFVQIRRSHSNEMARDHEIPLTQVKSHASSTGARRPNMGAGVAQDSLTSSTTNNEKHSHLHRRAGAGRRRKNSGLSRAGTDGSGNEVSLNAMGRLYKKIVGASVVTRYLVYIIPVAVLLAVPLIVLPVLGLKDRFVVGVGIQPEDESERRHGPQLFNIFLWIEIAWLTLWVGKLVAWFLPRLFMFLIGVVSSGTRKYATVLQNLQIPLSLFFWALASWLTFRGLFGRFEDGFPWVRTLGRVLGALFISSIVYLVEKALVQLIGISYHQRSFALRIKACKRDVYLLGLLYDASRKLFPMYCPEFEEDDYIIADSVFAQTGKKIGTAATPLKFVGNIGRIGDKVTAAFGNVASEITGRQVFNPNSAHSIVIEALEKPKPSQALARRIWMAFVCEGNDALYLEDVEEVLGPEKKLEAEEAFNAIDSDMNGDISLEEISRKVVEVSRERKAITEGMKDIGQALRVFDKVLMFVVLLIVIFIFLAWFQSSLLTTVATAGTALLSLSFIFAVTAQEFLGSCIFLFVKHPFDVGDRVDIVGPEKQRLVVDKISLLYSVFTRIDKMQVVQVPNIVLNNLWIENISRSKHMKEDITVNISFDTSFEDIELLRHEMEAFVRLPENSRDFQPDVSMTVDGVGDLDKLVLVVSVKHKGNWHNEAIRATRRSKFMCALTLAMKKVPIFAPGGGGDALGGPANPSYTVSVSDEVAAAAREESANKKDTARMVPKLTRRDSTASKTGSAKEREAAAGLNSAETRISDELGYRLSDAQPLSGVRSRTSEDTRRSQDVQRLQLDLMNRSSTRGKRRAGDTISLQSPTTNPNSPIVQRSQSRAHGGPPFDEEAQTSGDSPYSGALGGYYNTANQPTATQTLTPAQGQPQLQPYQRAQQGPSPFGPPPQGPPHPGPQR